MKCVKNTCMLYGRCSYPTACIGTALPSKPWTGPRPDELDPVGRLRVAVPPERWPFGPPDHHEAGCMLHEHGVAAFCDCAASGADDVDFGVSP